MKPKIFVVCLLSLIIYSCQQSDELLNSNTNATNETSVTLEDVTSIAIAQTPTPIAINGKLSKTNKAQEPYKLPRHGSSPSMYVVNYENNGFIIIAADKRISPILAYSDEGSFLLDEKSMPGGLVAWLSSIDETVTKIKTSNLEQNETLKKLWKKYGEKGVLNRNTTALRTKTTEMEGDCSTGLTEHSYHDPVLSTTWSQGSGYNDYLAYGACSQTGNGKYWTGCVATAVAQVMRYYSHPGSYNWASMPNNGPNSEVARVMRDIGTAGNLSVSYGCDGSSAKSQDIRRTLLNFGYSYAYYGNYDIWNAKGSLQDGRPIILDGRPSIFDDLTPTGHAWVADGVQYWGYYYCTPDPNTPGEMISVFAGYDCSMHMNWGWGGSYNGWYSANNFNPAGHNYNFGNHMVYSIYR